MSNKINSENADRLWEMLSNKDDSSIELAFNIIQESDFQDNETYFHIYNLVPTLLTVRSRHPSKSLVNSHFNQICYNLANSPYAKEFAIDKKTFS